MIYCNNPQSHCNICGSPEPHESSVKQHQVTILNLGIFLSTCQEYATFNVDLHCILNTYRGYIQW